MAKDDDTGVDPVSRDGGGATDDELAKRRKNGTAAGGSVADRALAAEQAALDGEDGESIAEADDGQYFVWERGTKITLSTLVKRGVPVEHAFVFGGKRVKGRGGLMGFDDEVLNVVRFLPGPVRIVPTRDDDEKVTKVVIENHVVAKTVTPLDSEDGLRQIAHILDKHGYVKKAAA